MVGEREEGNCDVDFAYQYLTFFFQDDDRLAEFREVRKEIPICRLGVQGRFMG